MTTMNKRKSTSQLMTTEQLIASISRKTVEQHDRLDAPRFWRITSLEKQQGVFVAVAAHRDDSNKLFGAAKFGADPIVSLWIEYAPVLTENIEVSREEANSVFSQMETEHLRLQGA